MYYPRGNATDPIWRVLASSVGISSWTPLKPQHSNPKPNHLINQLWCIDFLTPPIPLIIPHRLSAFLESLIPLKNGRSIHARWWKSCVKHSIRFCGIFPKFKTEFYSISFFYSVRLHFWNSPAVTIGCIPIAAVAVHLNLKSKIGQSSHKMYSNNILNFQENFKCLNKKIRETYWRLHVSQQRWIVKSSPTIQLSIKHLFTHSYVIKNFYFRQSMLLIKLIWI